MKRFMIVIITAICLILTGRSVVFGAEKTEYEYTIINGEAIIIGFTGEPREMDIPEFISSYPVTEIRDNAFYNCNTLKRISLPDTVTKIGHHSFYACYSLETVSLPAAVEEIGEGCFCGCTSLEGIYIPETLEVLPDSCFRACTSLKEAVLPFKLEYIGDFCFAGCTQLEYVKTGGTLTAVGERAFFMCDKLSSIYIPPSCIDIGSEAFGITCDGDLVLRQTDMVIAGGSETAAEDYAEKMGVRFSVSEQAEAVLAVTSINTSEEDTSDRAAWTGAIIFAVLVLTALWRILKERKKA